MRATIFIGSLKADTDESNTVKLCRLVKAEFAKYDVKCIFRYLRNRRVAPGIEFDTGDSYDEAGIYYKDVDKSEIIMFATPTWWGIHSSLVQQLMERLTGYDDEYIKSGHSMFYNKTFGCIITASNDGFQHIQGIMYNFATEMGMTIPPEAYVTWGTNKGSEKNPVENEETLNQIKNCIRNQVLWASVINKIKLGDAAQKIKPGRVGLLSTDKLAKSK